ncbi:glycosyltransferase family 2 protein [Aquabacterium sp.]|uniref:glycosyltransferase family 2 protein n=1 Tax=Aquabacterium sp. TaxID=1872578 RepID=UPI003B714717
MRPNPLLAIAIPTYNRSDILRENLRAMLPELLKHHISVYLSDDSSDDRTREMADDLRTEFPLLVYRKNDPRFGHDANFFATLAMPNTDYVWYLGDSLYCEPGTLGSVLAALAQTRPDFCFINAYAPEPGSRLIEGEAVHPFLLDRTWYLTLSGATIYGRAPRAMQIPIDRRADWKNFPQLGLILEACAQAPRRMHWLGAPMLKFNRKKSSYWLKSAFSVFVKDWSKLIRSFPTLFSPAEQDHVIRSHGVHTRLFGPVSLIQLRALGALTLEELERCGPDFATASPIAPEWARLVARLPQRTIAIIWSLAYSTHILLRRNT